MRIVIKIGTSTLAYPGGRLNIRHTEELVKTFSDLKNAGHELVLVSSGAIGMGAGKLQIDRPQDMPTKQAAAKMAAKMYPATRRIRWETSHVRKNTPAQSRNDSTPPSPRYSPGTRPVEKTYSHIPTKRKRSAAVTTRPLRHSFLPGGEGPAFIWFAIAALLSGKWGCNGEIWLGMPSSRGKPPKGVSGLCGPPSPEVQAGEVSLSVPDRSKAPKGYTWRLTSSQP